MYPNIFNINEVTIIKNFLSKNECDVLNDWTLLNEKEEFFKKGKEAENRKTTRYSKEFNFEYPSLIVNRFLEFKKKYGVSDFKNIVQGKNGIINAISYGDSELIPHKDPSYYGCESFHITIQTSKSEIGGDLVIGDKTYNVNEGDAVCFFASAMEHKTNKTIGNKCRIVWIMGIQYPIKKTNMI